MAPVLPEPRADWSATPPSHRPLRCRGCLREPTPRRLPGRVRHRVRWPTEAVPCRAPPATLRRAHQATRRPSAPADAGSRRAAVVMAQSLGAPKQRCGRFRISAAEHPSGNGCERGYRPQGSLSNHRCHRHARPQPSPDPLTHVRFPPVSLISCGHNRRSRGTLARRPCRNLDGHPRRDPPGFEDPNKWPAATIKVSRGRPIHTVRATARTATRGIE